MSQPCSPGLGLPCWPSSRYRVPLLYRSLGVPRQTRWTTSGGAFTTGSPAGVLFLASCLNLSGDKEGRSLGVSYKRPRVGRSTVTLSSTSFVVALYTAAFPKLLRQRRKVTWLRRSAWAICRRVGMESLETKSLPCPSYPATLVKNQADCWMPAGLLLQCGVRCSNDSPAVQLRIRATARLRSLTSMFFGLPSYQTTHSRLHGAARTTTQCRTNAACEWTKKTMKTSRGPCSLPLITTGRSEEVEKSRTLEHRYPSRLNMGYPCCSCLSRTGQVSIALCSFLPVLAHSKLRKGNRPPSRALHQYDLHRSATHVCPLGHEETTTRREIPQEREHTRTHARIHRGLSRPGAVLHEECTA